MIGGLAAEQNRFRTLLSGVAEQASGSPQCPPRCDAVIHPAFRYSGYQYREQRTFCLRLLLSLGLTVAIGAATEPMLAAILFCVVCTVAYRALARRVRQRSKAFESQYTAFLVSLASSIRAGHDPLSAIRACERIFPRDSILHSEIKKFERALATGITEDDAIWNFAASIQHPDISFFRIALVLARRQGASLGETLHRLTRVTRLRQSFRRRVKSALAMQRMSAIGISICAILVALLQAATNPKAMIAAWNHPFGKPLLGAGVGLVIIGLFWMLRLARERV